VAELGRWSDVAVETPDDELDAICNGVEFSQVEAFSGAVEKYAGGRLLLYLELRVHSDLWRLRKHPLEREPEWEGWLDAAFIMFNRFVSDRDGTRIPPTDIGRGGVHGVGTDDNEAMLVLVRQVSQERERRWVMAPAEFFCVVLESRRVGEPLGLIADREQDLFRLLAGWFSGLGLPSEPPGDVFERSAKGMDALTQRERQVDGRKLSEEQARDVVSLLRVVINDNALMCGVVKEALGVLKVRQTFATTLDLVSGVR
jgi:hypothetical protein